MDVILWTASICLFIDLIVSTLEKHPTRTANVIIIETMLLGAALLLQGWL